MAHYCVIEPSFTITQKDRFGSYLINCLRQDSKVVEEDKKFALSEYGKKMWLRIPEHYERNYGLNISLRHQHWFNKFVQEEFQTRMLMFVAPRLNGRKGTIKKALKNYRELYNIDEDDLPIKTLEKIWERNRHSIPCYMMN